MLEKIFDDYRKKSKNYSENEGTLELKNNTQPSKAEKEDFLNEEQVLDVKAKSDEILAKYCTLYKKGGLEPLNQQYLSKKRSREDRKSSAGPNWFNMKAPDLTPELLNELKAVKYGRIAEPFQFHKKDDRKGFAKIFQVGVIKDNIVDGKSQRLRKNEVKNSITKELLEFDKEQNFTLRKFNEYNEQRMKVGMKKNKLNKYKIKNKGKKYIEK